MQFIKKPKKWGNSLGISLPKDIVEEMNLDEDATLLVNITLKSKIKKYVCIACQLRFDTEDDNPYCPACENTNLEVLE